PPEVRDAYFEKWQVAQRRYVKSAEEAFAPLPAFHVPLQSGEVIGKESLERLRPQIHGEGDPTQVFAASRLYPVEKKNKAYRIIMALPFVGKNQVNLNVAGDELIVRIGTFKRYVPLPRSFQGVAPTAATLRNDELTITFGAKNDEEKSDKPEGKT